LRHFATPSFWESYQRLPLNVQKMADENYKRLKANLRHPSLHFKQIGRYRSVRVGLHYRALAVEVPDGLVWFWIGTHDEYQRMIKEKG
jgi:hypothetical protein